MISLDSISAALKALHESGGIVGLYPVFLHIFWEEWNTQAQDSGICSNYKSSPSDKRLVRMIRACQWPRGLNGLRPGA